MTHGPSSDWGEDRASGYKAKLGIYLFIVYCLIYAGYVAINIISPKIMEAEIVAGLNLAVVYGLGLIIIAIVMGMIYNAMCTAAEDRMNIPAGEDK